MQNSAVSIVIDFDRRIDSHHRRKRLLSTFTRSRHAHVLKRLEILCNSRDAERLLSRQSQGLNRITLFAAQSRDEPVPYSLPAMTIDAVPSS